MLPPQDLPELMVIRAQLAGKYGKDYLAEASSDLMCRKWHVNENLIRCAHKAPEGPPCAGPSQPGATCLLAAPPLDRAIMPH